MSSRTRARRGAHPTDSTPVASSSRTRTRGKITKVEPELETEVEEEVVLGEADEELDAEGEDDDLTPEPVARVKRGRGTGNKSARGRTRAKVEPEPEDDGLGDTDADGEEEEEEEIIRPTRSRTSIGYKDASAELGDQIGDEDAEGEDDDEEQPVAGSSTRTRQPPVRLSSTLSVSTPRRRARASRSAADDDDDDDKNDSPYKREKIPGGSGRGGFSIKGAAAAAARARWDKVRRERAERGEDEPTPRSARKRDPAGRRQAFAAAVDSYEPDSMLTIKGQEYKVGQDELVLPDDVKGEAKVDAEGRLLGGREYKLVTFNSEGRANSNRVYALTVDAARACGYTDSLAFLRRCPQILKLSCSPAERDLLITIGRIQPNLKHRQVTMVAMRNVFKMMGAKVVKGGKYVTDDYYEDDALVKCTENGWTPGAPLPDEEAPTRDGGASGNTRPARGEIAYDLSKGFNSLSPYYTVGGPTTQFGGSGTDPWTEGSSHNWKGKMRNAGITEEDWMLRAAEESRRIDVQLREYREERLVPLDGVDGTRGWVYALEKQTDQLDNGIGNGFNQKEYGDFRPPIERKPSALSRQVPIDFAQPETDTNNVNVEGDVSMELPEQVTRRPDGPQIIVEQPGIQNSMYNWGLGSWAPGVIRAAYEPHTHTPHIPQYTQPTSASTSRLSYTPILESTSDSQFNYVQSTLSQQAATGLASMEYVYETPQSVLEQTRKREREVEDALIWERKSRSKR